jgi:L,D-transpeptidase ErfK/SrfK
MRRIVAPSFFARGLPRLLLGTALLVLTGCAATKSARLSPVYPEQEIERHRFAVEQGADVIGRLAVTRVEKGDTLADLARHFGVGINAIRAANPGVDLWSPEDGVRITLPLSFILPDAPRKGIVVNLATMRLFHFREEGAALTVSTYPVGVGAKDRPTPTGQMHVARKAFRPTWYVPASIAEDHRKKGDPLPATIPPGPDNPLGEYALYLSNAGYLIHGTNKPASIGLKATNGCLRLYPENIELLYRDTPVNTPVLIVSQPYLVGQRDGVLYLEAHAPTEGAGGKELESIDAQLKALAGKSARALDWNKVRQVQAEARGIPIPILELQPRAGDGVPPAVEVAHPAALYGKSAIPELKLDAWYVLAGELADEREAQRLAAIINHQGPPIPARVLAKRAKGTGYRVIAGPFGDVGAANSAARRLKMDLDIDGIVIDPAGKP